MFDSDFNDAFEDCDCMFRDELLEGDKESALKGDGPLNVGQTGERLVSDPALVENRRTYALMESRVTANQRI